MPEVAISNNDSFILKGSWNDIPLEKVLVEIYDSAFNNNPNICPNPADPLFIHCRIKSGKTVYIRRLTNLLDRTLSNRLLDTNKYGYEYYNKDKGEHNNIGSLKLNSRYKTKSYYYGSIK